MNVPDLEDEDEDGLWEVCEENAHFLNIFNKYGDVASFLKQRNERIYARSVTISDIEQAVFLQYTTDIDGCVMELKSLRGVKMYVRHLTMNPGVRPIHSMLKKHFDLSSYSRAELSNIQHSVGFQLFYQQGWECWLGIVPSSNSTVVELKKEILTELSVKHFFRIKSAFRRKLFEFCSSDKALRTLMKNDINHIENIFILPDDSRTILDGLQESIDECQIDFDFRVILFCFRFGEKMSGGVSLKEFDHSEIESVTVHSAIDISSEYMDLFWSTSGLEGVVGGRGVLGTCISLSDCGNYQSNIDGRAMDISKDLRCVCHHPEKLRFIQMYADIAHHLPRTRFHPVSGIIAGGMVFPKPTSAAFKKNADDYISSMQTNFVLMKKSTCRLECVTELTDIKEVVMASDCLNVNKVFNLLEQQPLLVPFPKGTMKCVQAVGLWLTSELSMLLGKFSSTGNVEAIWRAFQLELAVEKILWGHPLCFRCTRHSINLGPGKLGPSRSLTDHMGFIALERWTACMASEESIPPCTIWTASEVVAKKIGRTVGIHDVLQSSGYVLGRRVLNTLLMDLFEVAKVDRVMTFEEFKHDLFSDTPARVKVAGAVTAKQLVQLLSKKRRLPVGLVYGSVVELIQRSGKSLENVLKDGLVEFGMKYFPAIQTYNNHSNAILTWSLQRGVWRIIRLEENHTDVQLSAPVLSMLVRAELERRNLVYVSKLKKVPSTLPWIGECVRKLSGEKLSDEGRVQVLSFLSCIAVMMNGWYVEYDKLQRLMNEMPINQYRLRELEIQSKLLLSHFNKFKLFRLHHTLSFRLRLLENRLEAGKPKQIEERNEEDVVVNEGSCNRIVGDESILDLQQVSRRTPTCVPVTQRLTQRWTAEELELLHDVCSGRSADASMMSLYDAFKQKCMQRGIPFRTFKAFANKKSRV